MRRSDRVLLSQHGGILAARLALAGLLHAFEFGVLRTIERLLCKIRLFLDFAGSGELFVALL